MPRKTDVVAGLKQHLDVLVDEHAILTETRERLWNEAQAKFDRARELEAEAQEIRNGPMAANERRRTVVWSDLCALRQTIRYLVGDGDEDEEE